MTDTKRQAERQTLRDRQSIRQPGGNCYLEIYVLIKKERQTDRQTDKQTEQHQQTNK